MTIEEKVYALAVVWAAALYSECDRRRKAAARERTRGLRKLARKRH